MTKPSAPQPNSPKRPTYEECFPRIDAVIQKNYKRYHLNGLLWMDWEDVQQIIRLHIFKKWHLWDPTKKLEPWVNVITINQIRNIIRNNWTNFARPCLRCEFFDGDENCEKNHDGRVSRECPLYKKWMDTKRAALDLRISNSLTGREEELSPAIEQEGMDAIIMDEYFEYMYKTYDPIDVFILYETFVTATPEKEIIAKIQDKYDVLITLTNLRERRRAIKPIGIEVLRSFPNNIGEN